MKIVVILNHDEISLCESDKYVLAEAIQLANESSGSVTVIGYGGSHLEQPLKECLTFGIDQAIHCDTQNLTKTDLTTVSSGIATELKHCGFDFILCGEHTADEGHYLTGMIANELNIPHITRAASLSFVGENALFITRQVQNKLQKLTCKTPLLCTSVNKSCPPIHPKITDIMKVYSGENKIYKYLATDFPISEKQHGHNYFVESRPLHIEETGSDVTWLTGSNEKEKADKLYQLLERQTILPDLLENNPAITYLEETYLEETKLTESNLIVSGGRGLKQDGFLLLEKLSSVLGGNVGCTRPCVDAGWADASHLIGQIGVTVHPRLYLAFAISGAVQHVSGMKDSDCIIGINTNPNADIFRYCDYGIEGDAVKILNYLLEKFER